MKFYSVYDLITYRAKQIENSTLDMYRYFRNRGIRKEELLSTQETGACPLEGRVLEAISNYLEMSPLEIELALGRVPKKYEGSYYKNIKAIAEMLQAEEIPLSQALTDVPNIGPFMTTDKGTLYNLDCIKAFPLVQSDTVDCVFADPPFNLSKEYDEGVDDNKSYSAYIRWCTDWLDECARVLKPGGSLFIYNIPKWHTYLAQYLNNKLTFFDWIAVDMKFSLPIPNRLYPSHYSLLWYVKGSKPTTFNPQRVPLQTCRHCGGELKDYGGYKNKMNPKGVNVSDVWTDIYPVRHSNSKNRKFNELPVKLLDRVISMSTNPGGLVLDPFGGSGTTFAVSELLDRNWIGFEVGNCSIIKDRIEDKTNDRLLLNKIYEEKDKLFPDKVKELRRKNGFWLAEDFEQEAEATEETYQTSIWCKCSLK
jgi:site-specific DNA-methyltransferase (adenine-specific)